MLSSEEECRRYLATHDPATIARQLRKDQQLCQELKLPTTLALHLPKSGSELANLIALALFPETSNYPTAIRRAQYDGLIMVIKSYLHQMKPHSKHKPLSDVIEKTEDRTPSKDDFVTALDVLDFCMKSSGSGQLNLKTPFEEIVRILQGHANGNLASDASSERSSKPTIKGSRQRKCYICQFILLCPHPQYPSLCKQCGDYNLASSELSLPQNLDLKGKTALVTGGRVNLGYHTALRLLRCGAKVIVSTRYPRDAEVRYLAEKDAAVWDARLKVVGADFRAASDVFHLVAVVVECLRQWDEGSGVGKLDILINNAAQTLTDPMEKESEAVKRETRLLVEASGSKTELLLGQKGYAARIKGGVTGSRILQSHSNPPILKVSIEDSDNVINTNDKNPKNSVSQYSASSKSSWMQSVHQIPYEDVISAHSVNTFVPLILLREFLPLMGSPSLSKVSQKPSMPAGYIINVSSREGIFESRPESSSKNGHHVHTNLTKAALNMLTETEAGPAWKSGRVAINSVDPGYMSAAPEIEKVWKERLGNDTGNCPIGWEDGAGRVLWPVAVGEIGKGAIWGRFLKHFGSVDVDVGIGR